MSDASDQRSREFLKISGQFKLGALVTEASHPVTAQLSDVAKRDIARALDLLFQVDADVIAKYHEFAESGRTGEIAETVLRALGNGGRVFFTGCGTARRMCIQPASFPPGFLPRATKGPKPSGPGDFLNRTARGE